MMGDNGKPNDNLLMLKTSPPKSLVPDRDGPGADPVVFLPNSDFVKQE